jgi:hypothetical protein
MGTSIWMRPASTTVTPATTTTSPTAQTLPTSVPTTTAATTLAVDAFEQIPTTTETIRNLTTPLTRAAGVGECDVLLALVALGLLLVVALLTGVIAVMCINRRRRRHRAQYELPPVVDGPIFRPQREE